MAQKTIKVGGEEVPLDDSAAVTAYVDVFTEAGVMDGVVYVGFGYVVGGQRPNAARAVDVVHLRMSPIVARRVAQALLSDAEKAERQIALSLQTKPVN
jgi:hypothetical protein